MKIARNASSGSVALTANLGTALTTVEGRCEGTVLGLRDCTWGTLVTEAFTSGIESEKSPLPSSDTHFICGKKQEMFLSWTIPLLFQAVSNQQVFEPMALMPCDGLDIT